MPLPGYPECEGCKSITALDCNFCEIAKEHGMDCEGDEK